MKNAILGFIAALILVGCIAAKYEHDRATCYLLGYSKGFVERNEIITLVTTEMMTDAEIDHLIKSRTEKQAKECGCF